MNNSLKEVFHSVLHRLRTLPFIRLFFMTPRQRLGRRAELCVRNRLRSEGYAILERNYQVRAGEIDIIAFRKGTIAFVEVRSRTGKDGFTPESSVTYPKQKKVISAARSYVAEHLQWAEGRNVLRFDVAAVTFDNGGRVIDLDYYEDAFRPD